MQFITETQPESIAKLILIVRVQLVHLNIKLYLMLISKIIFNSVFITNL